MIKHSTYSFGKTLKRVAIEDTFLNILKATFEKTTDRMKLKGQALTDFTLGSGTLQGCQLSALLLKIFLEVLATASMQEKDI